VASDRRRLQLWSYNYAPEPTGIAPVSASLARQLSEKGWDVQVVAAHPHYPEPLWGKRLRPYREICDGIPLLRLPLWIGRGSARQRMRQEATFTAALMMSLPLLGRPDVLLVTSPSFPALSAAIVNARVRRLPWVLWLHDLLPDGAVSTGLLDESSRVLRASRRLERSAYRSAHRIVVLSSAFADNLRTKGVEADKLELIYHPATRGMPRHLESGRRRNGAPRVLSMGNIGHTQGLAPLVAAFERSDRMKALGAALVVTGNGVAAPDVAREVRSDRVQMLGLVDDERLEAELRNATMALVSQSYEGTEFNLPSKLMNFMAYGLPIVAAVNPRGEVARLVEEAGAGWVADSSDPDALPRVIAEAHANRAELERRGLASRAFAKRRFSLRAFGDSFDSVLRFL
jgi:colanic acid biosynthesis glycosyl transferase WcaI